MWKPCCEYDAVFAAIGAHGGTAAHSRQRFRRALVTEFLRQASLPRIPAGEGNSPRLKFVLKAGIGGGNVAIDAAMTAAACALRDSPEGRQMPAHEWEIADRGYPGFPPVHWRSRGGGQRAGVRTVNVDFHGFEEGRPV
jgi:hypothetical protein